MIEGREGVGRRDGGRKGKAELEREEGRENVKAERRNEGERRMKTWQREERLRLKGLNAYRNERYEGRKGRDRVEEDRWKG